MDNSIIVYATKTCAWCGHVEKYLKMKGVQYEKILIDDEPDIRQYLLDITGAMTVPVTTDGTTFVVGWQPDKLNKLIQGE